MTSERDFIRALQQRAVVFPPVITGIGDDGAVLACDHDRRQVVVTDMLLDGVHFDLHNTSAELAGRKAVAVNLSDLAAMACRPTAAFVSLALPEPLARDKQFSEDLYRGIHSICEQWQMTLAGGDTNVWKGPFAINVCLTGIPFQSEPVLRSTAQPGDLLLVTGPLGGSLTHGRHLTFEPRLKESQAITDLVPVHAMMDISDGLSLDLHRMMEASGTGAVVFAESIPIHSHVPADLPEHERLQRALSDGEDFELLLAVAKDNAETILCHHDLSNRLTIIGEVTSAKNSIQIRNTDETNTPLKATGWQHL
ncbi:MAG: thiamine-phosphate kinase [Planctomycetaceae bacterium]